MMGLNLVKLMKIVLLGGLIWSLTLVWPGLNLLLAGALIGTLTFALGLVVLLSSKPWRLAPSVVTVPLLRQTGPNKVQSRPVSLGSR